MTIKKLTPEDFIFMEKEIVKFNKLMGNCVTDEHLIPTYQNLSVEEVVKELLPAHNVDDKIEILDALIDGAFVVFYWALLNSSQNTLENNESWLREYICIDNIEEPENIKDILMEMAKDINRGSSFDVQTHLCVLLSYYQTQYDIMGAYREVLRSNLSKFVPAESVDIDEEVTYIESVGRYIEITVEEIETEDGVLLAFKACKDLQNNVIFKKPKLIKTRNFSEPQLEQFILCKGGNMEKLKPISWLTEKFYLGFLGFDLNTYCPRWDEWLDTTLKGDFTLSRGSKFTVKLKNNITGIERFVWIGNHPYASLGDYGVGKSVSTRPKRKTANIFIEAYNKYLNELKNEDEKLKKELKGEI